MPIVSPPRLVGAATVARLVGVQPRRLAARLKQGDPIVNAGYLGKISNRHTWNLHEFISHMFADASSIEAIVDRALSQEEPSVVCEVGGCDNQAEMVGLCRKHLRRMMTAWRHAETSSLVTIQLVAMCQWIVERNAHIVLPPGFDPWSQTCMNDGCDNPTNVHGPDGWHGPLCPDCSMKFWSNSPDRPRPAWWKPTAA